MLSYFIPTAKGLAPLLEVELKEMGIENPQQMNGGVKFEGTLEQGYKVCLWSRFASRVLLKLSEFKVLDSMDLYLGCSNIPWETHFDVDKTFSIDFSGTNDEIRNTQFGALKIKDAIVDRFRKHFDERPNVQKRDADIRFNGRLWKDKATIYLDLSGSPLHLRGYRTIAGEAPLRETLAAGIIKRSGWQGEALLDPMCGSGTLVIEAAMMALNIAPGSLRETFGFEKWKKHDQECWQTLKTSAQVYGRRAVNQCETRFYGSDLSKDMIEIARKNAQRAGVAEVIEFSVTDAKKVLPPEELETGMLITNPPYGERLGSFSDTITLYTELGYHFKDAFAGWNLSMFAMDTELLSCLGMRAGKSFKFFNGPIECVLKNYRISPKRSAEIVEPVTPAAPAVKTKKNSETSEPINPWTMGQNESVTEAAEDSESELVFKEVQQIKPAIYAEEFANRLLKNLKQLEKWAKREGVECYRLYDADLPEYNVAIDRYAEYIIIQEYRAPKEIETQKVRRRFLDVVSTVRYVLNLPDDKLVIKVRERQKGRQQYEKLDTKKQSLVVHEGQAKLLVNLQDYLDTGLFLDHRPTRLLIGKMAKDKDFLNLFCYTATASVHAALGGAKSTTSVDMSKTYLAWGEDNFVENGIKGKHEFIQQDCIKWLQHAHEMYDLIFIDPPTFSNSKRMSDVFDVQEDHVALLTSASERLNAQGEIIFSNNKRGFKLDVDAIKALGFYVKDISQSSIPEDFRRNKKIHQCWILTKHTD
ncbi:bifunctional 23S rRNA (guanine(2069)-N(7))-methyltransferase RlmK/23S rRNA (guanine(2445)-N(2))-methyltransferase RlmL [Psychromonas sp. MB-3u-54]|uniref:bifunctional 23S rRNA (guanine(2069)-N(7))-methyltransferase RlmK/23S rRNA (guanine(2445)-N(2))-methyltransferase RlmL n=1 Tax=Psychromonas sp. MB-3u-54 TaxID=2058319 RepID=UPI000C34A53A|nr:bifunctional 23S rRNA (guanine(2069)-N(7))-methyltransferase RlmK/23S rRNA (guanine(2445)-N(2))-methyltransferase RlmL [Psychromonas sp. MB-3u-54]PKH01504.1 bifunctional 23S rRNA (guanine(2069)-N(7))-methyltransferase RlmK/23S rRNA (guanine(2445)-N(2))-methyltransferase RlmL [Psychromonas sp. MB-3u-54]